MALALAALWPQGANAGGEVPTRGEAAAPPSRVAALYAHLPLSFEINQGQANPKVKYLAHGQGYTLWLTARQAVLALRSSAQPSTSALPVVRLKLVDSDPAPTVGASSHCPAAATTSWATIRRLAHRIPTFAQVRYGHVYRGVDLVYYGRQGELEYDFELDSGSDPRRIHLGLEGAERVATDPRARPCCCTWREANSALAARPVAYRRRGRGTGAAQRCGALGSSRERTANQERRTKNQEL